MPVTADIEATYRIVTPAFVGGADQNAPAELRLPTIKGALRFWWRTLAWKRLGNDVGALWREEAKIFGSSDGDIGQSGLVLRFKGMPKLNVQPVMERGTPHKIGRGALKGAYYLGYGVIEAVGSTRKVPPTYPGQIYRPYLVEGQIFTVQAILKRDALAHQEEILDAFRLLGLVGGIGARARRGWGSVALCQLRVATRDAELGSLESQLSTIIRKHATKAFNRQDPPAWTCWSDFSRVFVIESGSMDGLSLLNFIGSELVQERSSGRAINGGRETLLGRPVEMAGTPPMPRYWNDHLMVARTNQTLNKHPKRVAFGLPHNYGPSEAEQVTPSSKENDRRASPLLMHIHELPGSSPKGVIAFLPSRFLPPGVGIRVGRRIAPLDGGLDSDGNPALWEPIYSFLFRPTLRAKEIE